MKVLFATYPWAFHTPGGGEMQLLKYKEYLENIGVEVTLLDQWNPRFADYDVVHYFSCIGGSIHFCKFVKDLGLPLFITSSLWITDRTANEYPIGEIREQLSLADVIIVNSDMEGDQLSQVLKLPRERFVTVYNGVDEYFLHRVSSELFIDKFGIDSKYILNVGNIEPRKNQLNLAMAMKQISDHDLVLIGRIRDEEYYRAVVDVAGDQLRYVGTLPHESEDLRSAYAGCSAFVLPSHLETPGLAALEAAAQGVNLVITEEGSAWEYFGGKAIYVDPMSTESIVAGIRQALEGGGRIRSERISRNYSWGTVTEKLKRVYEGLA